jgi:hypothetical protein
MGEKRVMSTPMGPMVEPVAVMVGVGCMEHPAFGKLVAFLFETPVGSNIYFLAPEQEDDIVNSLAAAIKQRRSGIVLPPGAEAGLIVSKG